MFSNTPADCTPAGSFSSFSNLASFRRSRWAAVACALAAALLVTASASAATQTVNTLADSNDGSCGTTCSLRDAITAAAAGDTISFTVTGTITLTSALPAISKNLTMTGPGADKLTISGGSAYQVFSVSGSTTTVAISGLTIANGKSTTGGGGIANVGVLTITDCVFTGNTDSGGPPAIYGGAIANSYGTLTVSGSTFMDNSESSAYGGAIYSGGGTLKVYNDTFAHNSSRGLGGAIASNVDSSLTIENNTFVDNSSPSGAAIYIADSTMNGEGNNLFSGNTGGSDNDSNITLASSDVSTATPMLLPLGNYGGATPTMLPLPGSAAVGAGSSANVPSGVTTDQRGFTLNSAAVDAGAVQTNYQQVTSSADSGAGTLRTVLTLANTAGTADIDFGSSLNGSTITLATALPAITGQVNIVGLGANELTISGNISTTVGSVLTVDSGAQATIYGVTVTGGAATINGGGINNSGTLSVIDCAISGNTASSGSAPLGGGIYSTGSLAILSSSISGNTASGMSGGGGGGIDSSGSLNIINSTISGNTSGQGGGISNSGTGTLTNVTVSGNSVGGNPQGGGIYNTGTLTLSNSIVEGNTAATNPDMSGSFTDAGGNLVNSGTSAVSPDLAALGSYGGTLRTMLPLPGTPGPTPGSAAICRGVKSLAVDQYGIALPTDERGFTMGGSSYCTTGQVDAGAVQTNYQSIQFTNGTNGYAEQTGGSVSPVPAVSVTENGQNIGGVPVTLDWTGGTLTAGTGTATTVAGTGATFSTLASSTAANGAISATLQLTGTASLTTNPTAEFDVVAPISVTPSATALSPGTLGATYSVTFATTGGSAPFTYQVTSGTLPPGLSLDANSGLLSGTPIAAQSTPPYSFTIKATGKHNYSGSASYTLVVNPGTPTASVTQPAVSYGTTGTIAITFAGPTGAAAPTGTVTYTLDGSTEPSVPVSGGVASIPLPATLSPGSHSVVWNYSGDTNYTALSSQTITQTVSAATLTVTVNSFSRAYGAANPTLTGTVSGLQGTDTATSVGLAYSTTATTSSAVGNYTITATIASSNYSLNVTQGTLTVTAASLAVTVNSLSRVYGAANPTLAGSISSGTLQNGDSTSSIGLAYSTTATASSPVGTYSINATISSGNYALTVNAGTLTVTSAPLSVVVNSVSRMYGAANPAFTGTPTGLQNSDSASSIGLAYSTTATAASGVGTYPISATIASTNYALTVTPGTLTVTTAPLSVTVNNATRNYGVANPAFTGTVAGLVNSDTAATAGLTYSTTATTSSPVGSYPITASVSSANYALSVTPGTLTIGKSGSGVTVSALTGASMVNQSVTFSAAIAPASGTGAPTGTVTFTDVTTGSSLCTSTVSSGQATCVTTSLRVGSNQTIQAAYSGDSNYNAGSGSVTQTVTPASSSLAVTSSLDPSVVLNPQNSSDTVNLMAAVSPSSGVPLSGSVTFTDNGAPIAECQAAVAVNPSTGVASCITKSLVAGTHTILAVYNGDPNYGSSQSSLTQQVQDYSLTTSTTSEITVSQGYTNTSDPFSPQSVTVNATPISGFTGNLALSCTVVAETVPSGAVPPTCSLGSATLAIGSGATSQAIALNIDAGSGSNSRATPGTYSVSVTGVDSATGLTRISAAVPVLVRSLAGPLTLVSGATSGNTVPVSFTLPANVGLSSLECVSVSGPTLTSSVAPIALGMSCAFNPDSVAATGTIQGAAISVTITTGGVTTAMLGGSSGAILAASMAGLPILLLLGFMPGGKKSRKVLCRYLGLACMLVLLLQGTGCGGGHFTAPPATSGTTPPGSYNILVQGMGTDNQTYQAVIQLNVTR